MSTIQVHDRHFKPMISHERIAERITQLSAEINKDYEGKQPLFLAVLNGAFMFTADLLKSVQVPSEVSFVKLASYRGTQSSGEVKELIGFPEAIKGRHVVIVEDIIDSGLSMDYILVRVKALEPASVRIATLLSKPKALKVDLVADYVGFEIENQFVLGYGLDYDGLGRNLPHIYVETQINAG